MYYLSYEHILSATCPAAPLQIQPKTRTVRAFQRARLEPCGHSNVPNDAK